MATHCLLSRATARAAALAAPLLALTGCPEVPPGTDLFRLAVNGAPGGSLLSVWGDSSSRRVFIAGGMVGVDPAALGGHPAGRLVVYEGRGEFRTVCTTDQVLWWVTGVAGASAAQTVVFAVGEGGRVVRYANGACTELRADVSYPEGAPTFWGAYAQAPDDVWLVGGSALPTGPRGVLVHYDGAHFAQDATVPAAAARQNLYKIDRYAGGGYAVVGAAGAVLMRPDGATAWTSPTTGIRPNDNRLFTVSCSGQLCIAVGGAGQGLVVRGGTPDAAPLGWVGLDSLGATPLDDLPGLNGVWMQDPSNVFVVGNNGLTMHFSSLLGVSYRPPVALTPATLHGVGGSRFTAPGQDPLVVAVGGELGVTNATQRGVVLVRGDAAGTFTFDGQSYVGTGTLRSSLGGTGQGGR